MSFCRHFLKLSTVFSLVIAQFSYAQERAQPPLATVTVKRDDLPKIEDMVDEMMVSNQGTGTSPKTRMGVDLIQEEVDAIRALIKDKSLPNSDKQVFLRRYGIGDKRVMEVLLEAKSAGVPVMVITDLNQSMQVEFDKGQQIEKAVMGVKKLVSVDAEEFTSDFVGRAKIKQNSHMGDIIDGLTKAGFEITKDHKNVWGKGWAIFSQPIYNSHDEERDPIMHHKDLVLVRKRKTGPEYVVYTSTMNQTPNARYNRMIKMHDAQVAEYFLEHMDNMAGNYAAGKETSAMDSLKPLRLVAKNGSHLEMAFTDGKYLPNDRIQAHAEMTAKNPQAYAMTEIVDSQFAPTNAGVFNAREMAMEANPQARLFAVHDGKFSGQNTFGLGAAMEGIAPLNLGKSMFPWKRELTERTEFYVYQRKGPGQVIEDLDGAPVGQWVWHDKTSVHKVTVNNFDEAAKLSTVVRDATYALPLMPGVKEQALLWTGSMNLSGNFRNAEIQLEFLTSADSWMIKDTVQSVKGVALAEKAYAIPAKIGILRFSLARVLGHHEYGELTVDDTVKFEQLLRAEKHDELRKLMQDVGARPTELKNKMSKEVLNENIEKFIAVLKWYDTLPSPYPNKFPPRTEKIINILTLIQDQKLEPFPRKQAIRDFLWEPNITDDVMEARVKSIWQILKFDINTLPPPRAPLPPGSVANTASNVARPGKPADPCRDGYAALSRAAAR